MQTNYKVIGIMVMLLSVLLAGCQQARRDWEHKVRCFEDLLYNKEQWGQPFPSEDLLRSYLGEPDFKGTPQEFRAALNMEEAEREYWINDFRYNYNGSVEGHDWKARVFYRKEPIVAYDFDRCKLWVYDETRHFRPPGPNLNPFEYQPNPSLRVFMVENGRVISSRCLGRWERDLIDYSGWKKHSARCRTDNSSVAQ